MTALQTLRRRSGLSQRALARRAGLAFRTVQLLEAGGHDARWSTLEKLAVALAVDKPETLLPSAAKAAFCAADAAVRMRAEGGDSWKLWLFEFVDAFRRAPGAETAARPPDPVPEPHVLALLASTVETLCAEKDLPAPWWCAGVPVLADPWFVSESENLKASALVESPPAFRKRNIFVLGNFLSRA